MYEMTTIGYFRTNAALDEYLQGLSEKNLKYYAHDIMEELGCRNISDLNDAINRAISACRALNIPLGEHFKRFYLSGDLEVVADWKFSSLAYCLVVLNADPSNPVVAKTQMEMIRKVTDVRKKTDSSHC